jgi:hypothetical protein
VERGQACTWVEVDAEQPPPEHTGVVTVRDWVPEVEQMFADVQALQAP